MVACSLSVTVSASAPYNTYTYSYWGDDVGSPHAYTVKNVVYPEKMEMGAIGGTGDITVDSEGNILVADPNGNRIVVFDKEYNFVREIKGPSPEDNFLEPRGIFVHRDGRVFIADAKNRRIVVFNSEFELVHIVPAPQSSSFPEGFLYEPSKIAVDYADRIYVICPTTNMGIIEITMEGEFKNFIGAQKVEASITSIIWKLLQTDAMSERSVKYVPTEFNNIAVDARGFVYITTSSIEPAKITSAIADRSNDGQSLPIRKLNPSGEDVLLRASFLPPAGEISVRSDNGPAGVSVIVDVALSEHGVYAALDQKRGKVFVYDGEGALLYIFGGIGAQEGLSEFPVAMTFSGTDILVLDGRSGRITVYERTEYGNQLHTAIEAYNDREYSKAAELWEKVLAENGNLDIAYIGMGKASLGSADYSEAMRYFRIANNTEYYSKAFMSYRKDFIRTNYIWLLLIGAVLVALLVLASRVISARNARKVRGNGIGGQFTYGFHVIVHPFSGFWDLKHERYGGMGGALIILGLTAVTYMIRAYSTGYLFRDYDVAWISPVYVLAQLFLPLIMWCVANWCLTSLTDGEGKFKEIFISTCYALLPMVLLVIPATIVGNFITLEEEFMMSFLSSISTIWVGFLIFSGTLSIHNYSLPKNIFSCLFTIVGMGIILFIVLLCLDVVGMAYGLFSNIVKELTYRM